MYKDVPGAKLESITGGRPQYILPCDIPVNITFTFGGKAYPMHPLDMSTDTGLGGGMCSATVSILKKLPARGSTENDDAQFQIRGDDGELVDLIAGVPSNSCPF
jgi:hypothetical protein